MRIIEVTAASTSMAAKSRSDRSDMDFKVRGDDVYFIGYGKMGTITINQQARVYNASCEEINVRHIIHERITAMDAKTLFLCGQSSSVDHISVQELSLWPSDNRFPYEVNWTETWTSHWTLK